MLYYRAVLLQKPPNAVDGRPVCAMLRPGPAAAQNVGGRAAVLQSLVAAEVFEGTMVPKVVESPSNQVVWQGGSVVRLCSVLLQSRPGAARFQHA